HLIVQNALHGQEKFPHWPKEKVHIVSHWYNGFDDDLDGESIKPELPLKPSWIEGQDPLHMVIVWSPQPSDVKHVKNLVLLPERGYEFEKLELQFKIWRWFSKLENGPNTTNMQGEVESIDHIVRDPKRGEPYLYQLLFRRYDILLVLGKTENKKKRHNSVQRAVSQMRSGVPVLLECNPAHAALCSNYSCTFKT
ncbi:MAG: hypothetical protein CO120_04940, partial [Gammaproteobacteria bacterium CG_4_9_14_3_um_filter_38_9]